MANQGSPEHMFGIMMGMDSGEKERQDEAQTAELCALAARIHAGTAQLVEMALDCDRTGAWHGKGWRSLTHWLSVVSGYDWPTCGEIVRVGEALRELPQIRSEFATGSLSFDKVRSLTRVAMPADEEMWLTVARRASGSQLTRICRAFARAMDETAELHKQPGVTWWWRDDGMLALSALLSPEDGALVIDAVEKALPEHAPNTADIGSRRADALVTLCTQPEKALPPRLVVHVEAGRSYIEEGPSLARTTAQRLGCDAEVVTITDRDGSPLDAGRARRLVGGRLRYVLQVRDKTCRFPGCCVPASKTHAHHIQHWMHGGKTDLANLVSLCGFHHRRLHDGEFRIRPNGFGIEFEDAHGTSLVPAIANVNLDQTEARPLKVHSPLAFDGGAPIAGFGYAVSVLCEASASAGSRASP